tara:strand:+ start:6541 stop:6696 length:156 start_codon:yes stop_codon:yes gene_type:complete
VNKETLEEVKTYFRNRNTGRLQQNVKTARQVLDLIYETELLLEKGRSSLMH